MLAFNKRKHLFILVTFICFCLLRTVFGQDADDINLPSIDDHEPMPPDEDSAPKSNIISPPTNSPQSPSQTSSASKPAKTKSTAEKIGGWPYPGPMARDATDDVPDGVFPFVRINEKDLENNKKHREEADQGLQNALWYLQTKAHRYSSNTTVFSVVNKKMPAPSNDSHDYMSLARYYWPNGSISGGLPYVRVDGHVNPEIASVPDYSMFHEMIKQVQFLSLAYYYFDNETYAERAVRHVHAWFLHPDTRMNPHLQYSSIIRGYDMGRAKGIIDFSVVPDLLDSIAILQHSKAWPPRMSAGLRVWFELYVDWLRNSPNGQFERTAHNNHGTYYDVQLLAISYFLGHDSVAVEVAQNATAARIGQQLLSSGEQYFETDRPFSWFYSVYNLRGLFQLAELAERVKVDLWSYKTVDGKSIKGALDFLLPGAVNNSGWQFLNTQDFSASSHLVEVLQKAYVVYGNPEYLAISRLVSNQQPQLYNITRLTMPWDQLKDDTVRRIHTEAKLSSASFLPSSLLTASIAIIAMVAAPLLL